MPHDDELKPLAAIMPQKWTEAYANLSDKLYHIIDRAEASLLEADWTAWHPASEILEAAGHPELAQRLFRGHRAASQALAILAEATPPAEEGEDDLA